MDRDDSSDGARVVVTGDVPLFRTAIARLIASDSPMDVVAECANEREALTAAMTAAPDVVVMDVDLDSRNGGRPDLVAALLGHTKPHPVLILTSQDSDSSSVTAALANGASGIVMKDRPTEVFFRAIRSVAAGDAFLEPATLARVFGPTERRRNPAATANLTRREQEIVELVCLGLKNKKIGERLFISETTVRHHLTSIFNKLAVSSRLELMRYSYSGVK